VLTLILRWVRRSRVAPAQPPGPVAGRPVVALLVLSLVAYLLLQFRVSLFAYDLLAPFKVITFPYRMMTLITPLALLLAAVIADWWLHLARQRWPGRFRWLPASLAGIWLVLLVVFSPVTAHEPPPMASFFPYAPFLPVQILTAPAKASFQGNPTTLPESGPMFIEYLPKVTAPNGQELGSDSALYQKIHADRARDASLSSVPCSVAQRSGFSFEALHATYAVKCAGPTLVALPISYNSFTRVGELGPKAQVRPLLVLHVPTDPRIVVRVHDDKPHLLVVDLPTLARILFP
jgi:hypothetical protein